MADKLLVTYVMAGIRSDWPELVTAMAEAGVDGIEIGLPFSDPMLDGPVIQEACVTALDRGVKIPELLAEVPTVDVPLYAMTYANHLYSRPDFLGQLKAFDGVIIPDLPFAEAGPYVERARKAQLDAVLMVAPSTPPEQVTAISRLSRGFVYLMTAMVTTGSAFEFTATAAREPGAPPFLAGFGVDTPERAREVSRHADGVVVASALMRLVLDGASVDEVAARVREFREAV